jgi:hypothetical protein
MSGAPKPSKAGANPTTTTNVNNRQRASAANSRELLASSGGGFLGFEAFRVNSSPLREEDNEEEGEERREEDFYRSSVYTGTNEFLGTIFRTLTTKTDATTVQRATTEFIDRLSKDEELTPSELRNALPHFAFIFSRLARDPRHRVRGLASKLLLAYTQRVPIALQSKGVKLLGADWLCLLQDAAASESARASLICAKLDKDGGVEGLSYGTLHQLVRFVRQKPEDALSWTPRTSQEEEADKEDMAVRVRSHALLALARCLPSNPIESFTKFDSLFTPSFWKTILMHESPIVRRSAYVFLTACALKYPKETLGNSSVEINKIICRIPQEKDRSATPNMWEALITSIQASSAAFFEGIDVRKAFLPVLYQHFERGFNQAGTSATSCVLPLLSILPKETKAGNQAFIGDWCEKLMSGASIAGEPALSACLESIWYYSTKLVTSSEENEEIISRVSLRVWKTLFEATTTNNKGPRQQQSPTSVSSVGLYELLARVTSSSILETAFEKLQVESSRSNLFLSNAAKVLTRLSRAMDGSKSSSNSLDSTTLLKLSNQVLLASLKKKKSQGDDEEEEEEEKVLIESALEDLLEEMIRRKASNLLDQVSLLEAAASSSRNEKIFFSLWSLTPGSAKLDQKDVIASKYLLHRLSSSQSFRLDDLTFALSRFSEKVDDMPLTKSAVNEILRAKKWFVLKDNQEIVLKEWLDEINLRNRLTTCLNELRRRVVEISGLDPLTSSSNLVESDELVEVETKSALRAFSFYSQSSWPENSKLYAYLYSHLTTSEEEASFPVEYLEIIENWCHDLVTLSSKKSKGIQADLGWIRVASDLGSFASFSRKQEQQLIVRFDLALRLAASKPSHDAEALLERLGLQAPAPQPFLWGCILGYVAQVGTYQVDTNLVAGIFHGDQQKAESLCLRVINGFPSSSSSSEVEALRVLLTAALGGDTFSASAGFVEEILRNKRPRVVYQSIASGVSKSPELLGKKFKSLMSERAMKLFQALRDEMDLGSDEEDQDSIIPQTQPAAAATATPPAMIVSRAQTPEIREWNVGDAVCYESKTIPGINVCAEILSKHPMPETGEIYYTISAWDNLFTVPSSSEAKEIQTVPERLSPRTLSDEEASRVAVSKLSIAARAKSDRKAIVQLMNLQAKLTTIAPVQQQVSPLAESSEQEQEETSAAAASTGEREWRRVESLPEKVKICLSDLVDLGPLMDQEDKRVISRVASSLSSKGVLPRDARDADDLVSLMDLTNHDQNDPEYVSALCSQAVVSACSCSSSSSGVLTNLLEFKFAASKSIKLSPNSRRSLRVFALSKGNENQDWTQLACYVLLSEEEAEDVVLLENHETIERWIEVLASDGGEQEQQQQTLKLVQILAFQGLTLALQSLPVDNNLQADEADHEDAIKGAKILPRALLEVFLRFLDKSEKEPSSHHETKSKWTTYFSWLLLARRADKIKTDLPEAREWISAWLASSTSISPSSSIGDRLMSVLCESDDLIHETTSTSSSSSSLTGFCRQLTQSSRPFEVLTRRAWFVTVGKFPSMVREWYSNRTWSDRSEKQVVFQYVKKHISPMVLREDLSHLEKEIKEKVTDASKFNVKASAQSRVVAMTIVHDETSFDTELHFPEGYPLFQASIVCTKRIGIRPDKWQKWSLQIIQLLSRREGTLAEAVFQWKTNIDSEYQGVEPCPICYAVAHVSDGSVPKSKCKTCNNVFHSKCLGKWWASTHQSLCPLCKTSFMA